MKKKIQMKHLKLFEEIYSEIPAMSSESIKNMSVDEFFISLRKLAMKERFGELHSMLQIYTNSHPEIKKDYDFMKKLGGVVKEFNIDSYAIPGLDSPEELAKLRSDSETSLSNLDKMGKEERRKEYWEKVRTKSQELKDIADRIDKNGTLDTLIKKANDILKDMQNVESSFIM